MKLDATLLQPEDWRANQDEYIFDVEPQLLLDGERDYIVRVFTKDGVLVHMERMNGFLCQIASIYDTCGVVTIGKGAWEMDGGVD